MARLHPTPVLCCHEPQWELGWGRWAKIGYLCSFPCVGSCCVLVHESLHDCYLYLPSQPLLQWITKTSGLFCPLVLKGILKRRLLINNLLSTFLNETGKSRTTMAKNYLLFHVPFFVSQFVPSTLKYEP